MATWQRDKSKERFWRRMLQRWRRSQLTVRDFCAQLGLAEHNFFAWQRVIAERDQEAAASGPASPPRVRKKPRTKTKTEAPPFVPVHIVPDSVSEAPIEIALPGGQVLRVRRGFDADTLTQVLALFEAEGRRC